MIIKSVFSFIITLKKRFEEKLMCYSYSKE